MTLCIKTMLILVFTVVIAVGGSGLFFLHHFEKAFRNSVFESIDLPDSEGALQVNSPAYSGARGKKMSFRPYCQRSMIEKSGVLGQPYRSRRNGMPVLAIAANPADRGGSALWPPRVSINLFDDPEISLIRTEKIGHAGYIYYLDRSRLMILHSKPSAGYSNLSLPPRRSVRGQVWG